MDGAHVRTLQRALAVVENSRERLCAALGISLDELDAYLRGEKALPHQLFIYALDIVAGNNKNKK